MPWAAATLIESIEMLVEGDAGDEGDALIDEGEVRDGVAVTGFVRCERTGRLKTLLEVTGLGEFKPDGVLEVDVVLTVGRGRGRVTDEVELAAADEMLDDLRTAVGLLRADGV